MTRILYVARLLIAQLMPAMTSLVRPVPLAPSTRTLISFTPGATPPVYSGVTDAATLALPAMMPAMCVPWPNASLTDGSPVTKLTFATTLFVSALCAVIPESTTATPISEPFTPAIAPMPSSPDLPAQTWSAAVDLFDTDIDVRTSTSPDSSLTPVSAANPETSSLLAYN